MKITFVMANPNMSGGDRVCAIYAKKLAEMGHEVCVVAPKKRTLPLKRQIKRLLKREGWLPKESQTRNHFANMNISVLYGTLDGIVSDADVPDSDIIIATWWQTALWVNKLSRVKGKKFYFIQGLDYVNETVSQSAVEETYQFEFQKMTIAGWIKELLAVKYGIKDVPIIPNSVDHEIFYAKKRQRYAGPSIGFLFSEAECKGVPIALNVIEQLRLRLPELSVFSFGSTAPQKLVLPNYVSLAISPRQEEIRDIYQQCDVWLCCSLSEGFGLTILEAMACGTPVVSTRCGGPEDIISDGENGFLCDINDVESLTESVMTLLSTEDSVWEEFSINSMGYANSYSWDQAAKKFESALLELV
jgi:glycosyltransferase involved in cell wall biosynthesis